MKAPKFSLAWDEEYARTEKLLRKIKKSGKSILAKDGKFYIVEVK